MEGHKQIVRLLIARNMIGELYQMKHQSGEDGIMVYLNVQLNSISHEYIGFEELSYGTLNGAFGNSFTKISKECLKKTRYKKSPIKISKQISYYYNSELLKYICIRLRERLYIEDHLLYIEDQL